MLQNSMTFTISGEVDTQITITETADGGLKFELQVLGTGAIGDLRAVFFDLNGLASDDGLRVTGGTDVTDSAFAEEGVDSLGRDANIKGSVSNERGDFDAGIEFGTSGMAGDDIQSTSFTLSHDSIDLDLSMLSFADFGLRYTSVGDTEDARNGSAKIGGESGAAAQNDIFTTDEATPLTITAAALLANDGAGAPDGVTLTIVSVNDSGLAGALTQNPDGSFSYDPQGQFDDLATGEVATETFTYTVDDGLGGQSTATATITITGVDNGPPLFTDGNEIIVFDDVLAGTYLNGSQYDALDGTDRITLPSSLAEAQEAGFDLGQTFMAGDGNDTVFLSNVASAADGGAGFDTMVDGLGNDTISGGADADRIFSVAGSNVLDGGEGVDILTYQRMTEGVIIDIAAGTTTHAIGVDSFTGFETYDGSEFDDVFLGSDERDVIRDFKGNDLMQGMGGNDSFQVFEGNDTVLGGDGNDGITLNSAVGSNVFDGGAGRDTIQLALISEGVTVDLSAGTLQIGTEISYVSNFEVLYLTQHDDVYVGTNQDDNVYGSGGNDVMSGLAGSDVFNFDLRGDGGDDTITDFDLTEDALRINFSSAHGPAYSRVSDLNLQQIGADTLLTFVNDDTLLLEGINAGDLTAANFHFYL